MHQAAIAVFALACLLASVIDFRHRRLPNWLCAATGLAGLGFGLAGGGWALAGSQALHGLIVLAVGIGLYAIKWFGAGDAKFWAGIAAWFPLSKALLLLVSVAIGAVMLVFVWFVLRRLLGRKAVKDGRRSGGELPFGVAISLGAAMAYFIGSGVA